MIGLIAVVEFEVSIFLDLAVFVAEYRGRYLEVSIFRGGIMCSQIFGFCRLDVQCCDVIDCSAVQKLVAQSFWT